MSGINPNDDVRLSSVPSLLNIFLIRRTETHFRILRGCLGRIYV
jgi:hypothetical protein